MAIDRKYIESFTKKRYLAYIKQFPVLKEEKARKYTAVILTFATMVFFGIFAINPTLITIAQLKRQLTDTSYVSQQLQQKITNMSILQQEYSNLSDDLPTIMAAIPDQPDVAAFAAQTALIAKQTNVTIDAFQTSEVQLASSHNQPTTNASYIFSLEAAGSYQGLMDFLTSMASFNRLITFDSLTIKHDDTDLSHVVLTVRGEAYFQQ